MVEEKVGARKTIISNLTLLEKILIVVAVILLVLFVILLVKGANKDPNKPIVKDDVINNSLKDDYCNSNIVINKLMFRTLKSEIYEGPKDYDDITSVWADGSLIQKAPKWHVDSPVLRCHLGEPANGENENYFYCPDLYYTRTNSNENGESLKVEEYIIDLILDRDNYDLHHTHPPGWTAQVSLIITHDIVDYNCRKL
jgi:hypothetical protein